MKKIKKYQMVILAFLLLGGGIYAGMNYQQWFHDQSLALDTHTENYTGNKETYTGQKNTDTIDIPGFDVMNVKAGTTKQKVNLYNPEENTVYFKMSIYLNDGTKLWESELVEPGKAIYTIDFNQSLTSKKYTDCILKYECFAMDEEYTPLNGSQIKFTLNVLD